MNPLKPRHESWLNWRTQENISLKAHQERSDVKLLKTNSVFNRVVPTYCKIQQDSIAGIVNDVCSISVENLSHDVCVQDSDQRAKGLREPE